MSILNRLLALILASLTASLSLAVAQPEEAAQPKCIAWFNGTCIWTKEDEELLKRIEEYEKQNPRVFIPEASVYVPGRGYVIAGPMRLQAVRLGVDRAPCNLTLKATGLS